MLTASAEVAVEEPHTLVEALAGHLREQDMPFIREGDDLHARLPQGEAVFRPGRRGLLLEARAQDRAEIEAIVAFMALQVREFCVTSHPVIAWEGAVTPGETFADFRELRVTAVERLSPRLRRITFAATDLERFSNPARPYVRLHFPPEGLPPRWPRSGPDGLPLPMEPGYRPAVRPYTIEHADPMTGALRISFALHDGPGPGSDWARYARSGDVCGMGGPEGPGFAAAERVVLAGDETAVGAISRMLADLSPTARGVVLIAVAAAADLPPLAAPPGVAIRPVIAGPVAPHMPSALAEALRAVAGELAPGFALWAGCEAATARVILRDLRTHPLASHHRVQTFWERGVPSGV